MEVIFEMFFTLIKNKKISKWIRYPLILIMATIYFSIIGMLLFAAINFYDKNLITSMFFRFNIFISYLGFYIAIE